VALEHHQTWDGVSAGSIPSGWTVNTPLTTTATLTGGVSAYSSPNVLVLSSTGNSSTYFATYATGDGNNGNVRVVGYFNAASTSGAQVWGVFARANSGSPQIFPGNNFAWAQFSNENGDAILYSCFNGSLGQIGKVTTSALVDDDWYALGLTCDNTFWSLDLTRTSDGYVLNSSGSFVAGGALAIAGTNTNITGAGYAGITLTSASDNTYADDWYLFSTPNVTFPPPRPVAQRRSRILVPSLWLPRGLSPPPAPTGASPYWSIRRLDASVLRRRLAPGSAWLESHSLPLPSSPPLPSTRPRGLPRPIIRGQIVPPAWMPRYAPTIPYAPPLPGVARVQRSSLDGAVARRQPWRPTNPGGFTPPPVPGAFAYRISIEGLDPSVVRRRLAPGAAKLIWWPLQAPPSPPPPPNYQATVFYREPIRSRSRPGWIYRPWFASNAPLPLTPRATWAYIHSRDTSRDVRRLRPGSIFLPRPGNGPPALSASVFSRPIISRDQSPARFRAAPGRVWHPTPPIPGATPSGGFTQQWIASVNPPQQYGTDLYLSWTTKPGMPSGLVFQVYQNDVLVWFGTTPYCTIPVPPYLVTFTIGTVGASQGGTSFGSSLPPVPLVQAELNWLGGTFEDGLAMIAGFYVYGEHEAGAGIDYTNILGTIPAYTQGQVTDGYGYGGFGQGGFGEAAGSYSWISQPLTAGTWNFAVVPFDVVGNQGTPATTAVTILAPPLEPGLFPDQTRLRYTYNTNSHEVTLSWNPSPSFAGQ
jgi:hypothetical protein